jgi:deoxyribodipyrimidine photo-lyase
LKKTLYWFTNDLRLSDNEALSYAVNSSEQIAFVYLLDAKITAKTNFSNPLVGNKQLSYILDSLSDLSRQLEALGHSLIIIEGDYETSIRHLTSFFRIDTIVCSHQTSFNERRLIDELKESLPHVKFEQFWQHTLFSQQQIAEIMEGAKSFSQFRNKIEKRQIPIAAANETINEQLKSIPNFMVERKSESQAILNNWHQQLSKQLDTQNQRAFLAGESGAHQHLADYFNSGSASTYKETRNELDGWQNSTKFSPFLAIGLLSPRQIWRAVDDFELANGANQSTYWIKFELLWREYFQWLGLQIGARLFSFKGLANSKPLTSFFPERYQKWCNGNTPFPLVNALMKQLNQTGYMSNRGRQIVASCFVHELQLDWRYGAAYFQQQLLDHDVTSNWGNWQYIAGVGVDPRGGRHFNITKQTDIYDPKGAFTRQWQGDQNLQPLDSIDCSDWPITCETQ